jgi:hypothetical protein
MSRRSGLKIVENGSAFIFQHFMQAQNLAAIEANAPQPRLSGYKRQRSDNTKQSTYPNKRQLNVYGYSTPSSYTNVGPSQAQLNSSTTSASSNAVEVCNNFNKLYGCKLGNSCSRLHICLFCHMSDHAAHACSK